MPYISLNERLPGTSKPEGDKVNTDINTLVAAVTSDILSDSPGLVADTASGAVKRDVLETAIIKDIDRHEYHLGISREALINKVFDYMFGFGPLQPYIKDEGVSDIDGTGYNEFAIKRNGIRERIDINFGNSDIFQTYLRAVAVRYNGILNRNDSQCRVTDVKNRLRITLSIPPRNVFSPSLCIRKHRQNSYNLQELIRMGMITEKTAHLIQELANKNASVFFCGKGAAGKTTLLRAFINVLPEMDRVLVAESDPEIYPDKPFVISQRVKYPNEGGNPVTLSDIVRDALKMSIDTITIGEAVGSEMWDLIDAGFTGHRVLATLHSESAEDSLPRALSLAKRANIDIREDTVKEMLAKSVDYIFYLKDFQVAEVLEVAGYDRKEDSFMYKRIV